MLVAPPHDDRIIGAGDRQLPEHRVLTPDARQALRILIAPARSALFLGGRCAVVLAVLLLRPGFRLAAVRIEGRSLRLPGGGATGKADEMERKYKDDTVHPDHRHGSLL